MCIDWGMHIMGENPGMSNPDLNHARHALASIEHLVVQDIFMTETARLADVVLPVTACPKKNQRCQQHRPHCANGQTGDVITVQSRRGEVAIHVRRDDGTPQGAVFMPFSYYEAAANLLTNAALDPFGKIPEFKHCAVAGCPRSLQVT